jgi:hypothetical protein
MKRFLTNTLIRMICLTVSVIWSVVFFTVAIKIFDKLWG